MPSCTKSLGSSAICAVRRLCVPKRWPRWSACTRSTTCCAANGAPAQRRGTHSTATPHRACTSAPVMGHHGRSVSQPAAAATTSCKEARSSSGDCAMRGAGAPRHFAARARQVIAAPMGTAWRPGNIARAQEQMASAGTPALGGRARRRRVRQRPCRRRLQPLPARGAAHGRGAAALQHGPHLPQRGHHPHVSRVWLVRQPPGACHERGIMQMMTTCVCWGRG